MRTDTTCSFCGQAVRKARTQNGNVVLLDPVADKLGVVWVDGYNIGGEMRVNVVAHRDDVPRNEPLRYFIHECGAARG